MIMGILTVLVFLAFLSWLTVEWFDYIVVCDLD